MMAWRRSGDKPLSETMMVGLLTHICVTRPQLLTDNGGLTKPTSMLWHGCGITPNSSPRILCFKPVLNSLKVKLVSRTVSLYWRCHIYINEDWVITIRLVMADREIFSL